MFNCYFVWCSVRTKYNIFAHCEVFFKGDTKVSFLDARYLTCINIFLGNILPVPFCQKHNTFYKFQNDTQGFLYAKYMGYVTHGQIIDRTPWFQKYWHKQFSATACVWGMCVPGLSMTWYQGRQFHTQYN